MPRWPPIHPDLVVAVRVLDADGKPYAELWRELRPVASRLGIRCPSYWLVRRLALRERAVKERRAAAWAEVSRDPVIRPLLPRFLR